MAIKKNLEREYSRWCNSNATELYQIYGHCSAEKHRGYKHCVERMRGMNGHDFRIVSHNSWQFTVGWLYEEADGTKMFWYETACNSYTWPVPQH